MPPAAPAPVKLAGRAAGPAGQRRRRIAQAFPEPAIGFRHRCHRNACRDAHAVQRVQEISCGDVARRGRCERAAAESTGAGVEHRHAIRQCCVRIRISRVSDVVQVPAQRGARGGRPHPPDEPANLGGTATPIVSASPIPQPPASRARPAIRTTRSGRVRRRDLPRKALASLEVPCPGAPPGSGLL